MASFCCHGITVSEGRNDPACLPIMESSPSLSYTKSGFVDDHRPVQAVRCHSSRSGPNTSPVRSDNASEGGLHTSICLVLPSLSVLSGFRPGDAPTIGPCNYEQIVSGEMRPSTYGLSGFGRPLSSKHLAPHRSSPMPTPFHSRRFPFPWPRCGVDVTSTSIHHFGASAREY